MIRALGAGLLVVAQALGQAASRPMSVEDLFTLSELSDVTVSPDGARMAFTLTRPGNPNGCPTCNYKQSGDVWLIERATGAKRNLTNGGEDGGSSWMPAWSPDGARLAFVSTRPAAGEPRGGGNIRLHVWDSATGSIKRLAERGVCLQVEARAEDRPLGPVVWLDNRSLLVALLQPGVAADQELLYWRRGVAEARRAWARADEGKEPSASVVESGGAAPDLPTVSLQRIDVTTGAAVTLAELPKWDLWDLALVMPIAVSPDDGKAAVLVTTGTVPPREPADGAQLRTWRCGTVALEAPAPVRWAAADAAREHLDGSLGEWSPDGESFFVSESVGRGSSGRRMLIVSASTGEVADATPPGMVAGGAVWTGQSRPLVRARPAPSVASSPAASRFDWWIVGAKGPVNLTASMAAVPSRLFRIPAHGASLLGFSRAALWAVDTSRDAAAKIVDLPGATSMALPLPGSSAGGGARGFLVYGMSGSGATLSHVPVFGFSSKEVQVWPIVLPSPTARHVDGRPTGGALAFIDETRGGTVLWTTDGLGENPVRALTVNPQVATIAEGRRMPISYRSADGEDLQGLVILPPGYEQGRRYPVATWVYGGLRIRGTETPLASKLSTRPLNLELLSGHGYVVLIPSIPLAPFGTKSDPLTAIPKAVLPRVDRLVELGIADPERLAVLGHSTGGYTTYAMVTQTNRFKAAVALSGHPDLVSLWGQFYPGERVNPRAHEGLAQLGFVEYGPMSLGAPPWADPERYVRNSPIFRFDQVTTPLLIVHGDFDGAPIQQGEEAFTGLWRQGKRARFVRYWGEGHVVSSPANVRHLWGQIFDWLDTHLGGPGPTK